LNIFHFLWWIRSSCNHLSHSALCLVSSPPPKLSFMFPTTYWIEIIFSWSEFYLPDYFHTNR
jgi:hypothetical protein